MNTIKINDIDLVFNDEQISYSSSTENKTISFKKNDDKSFTSALMQIINLIEFKNSKIEKEKI